jgi:hypothetical protein
MTNGRPECLPRTEWDAKLCSEVLSIPFTMRT